MKNSSYKEKLIFNTLGVIFLLLLWFISSVIINKDYVLPGIDKVFISLIKLFESSKTYINISLTLLRIIISLSLGYLIGIILGLVSIRSKKFHYFISPFIKITRALPIASIILIIFILVGSKGMLNINISPILVSLLLIIPLSYESVYQGISNIDKDLISVSKVYVKNRFQMITKCYFPLIKKDMRISLSQSIGLTFKSMVMAEYVTQANRSIGNSLLIAKSNIEYDKVFAWTIILIILSIIFDLIGKYITKEK